MLIDAAFRWTWDVAIMEVKRLKCDISCVDAAVRAAEQRLKEAEMKRDALLAELKKRIEELEKLCGGD